MFRRNWWMLLVMVPVGMVAGWVVAAAVTYVMPKQYESSAIVEIKTRQGQQNAVSPFESDGGMTPIVCGTEFNVMLSRNLLSRVVDSLELHNRWSTDRERAIHRLKGIVRTEHLRGTDLISVSVRCTDKVDARDIAAEVVASYRHYREEMAEKSADRIIMAIKRAARDEEDKLEEKRKIVMVIAKNRGARGEDPDLDMDYADAKREFEAQQALLDQLKLRLVTEEINSEIGEPTIVVHEDPVIADLPVSPNVALNLLKGTVGGALVSPLLALPLMAWLGRKKPTTA